MTEQLERRAVGPVQVVEREDERPVGRERVEDGAGAGAMEAMALSRDAAASRRGCRPLE